MALLWQRSRDGKTYEVRTAGKSRRLYTDGVFHSQMHPQRFLTNNVWDVLSLPSLFLAPANLGRVLVLGVGGGAVIRQIGQLFPQAHFTGVELDANHLYVAKTFFGLESQRIKLVHADAITWLRDYRGPKFDLIIEDLFTEKARQPVRVMPADRDWFAQLTTNLSVHGLLIMNFISSRELRRCSYFQDRASRGMFGCAYGFATPVYENVIGVFLRQHHTLHDWHAALQRHPQVQREYSRQKSKYRLRAL